MSRKKVTYSEKGVCIDLILDSFPGSNPFKIKNLAMKELDIELTVNEIVDYLNVKEDFEKASREIEMSMDYEREEYE